LQGGTSRCRSFPAWTNQVPQRWVAPTTMAYQTCCQRCLVTAHEIRMSGRESTAETRSVLHTAGGSWGEAVCPFVTRSQFRSRRRTMILEQYHLAGIGNPRIFSRVYERRKSEAVRRFPSPASQESVLPPMFCSSERRVLTRQNQWAKSMGKIKWSFILPGQGMRVNWPRTRICFVFEQQSCSDCHRRS
jgi:hypothetical protein